MGLINERQRYNVTSSLIDSSHRQTLVCTPKTQTRSRLLQSALNAERIKRRESFANVFDFIWFTSSSKISITIYMMKHFCNLFVVKQSEAKQTEFTNMCNSDCRQVCQLWQISFHEVICLIYISGIYMYHMIWHVPDDFWCIKCCSIMFFDFDSQGMAYIHHNLHSHGHLRSGTCLIDNRWQIKLASVGLEFIKSGDRAATTLSEHQRYKKLLWTAPEQLRMDEYQRPCSGTQKGDTFSLAIVLQEIIFRAMPYFDQYQNPKGKHAMV